MKMAEVKTQGRYAGVRARLGGDGDINLNGAAVIAEDFYSVLGLVIMSQAAVSRNLSFVFVGIYCSFDGFLLSLWDLN